METLRSVHERKAKRRKKGTDLLPAKALFIGLLVRKNDSHQA